MKTDAGDVLAVTGIIGIFGFIATMIAGYITNVIWLIQNGFGNWEGEVVVATVGCVFPPLGVIHGIYCWF